MTPYEIIKLWDYWHWPFCLQLRGPFLTVGLVRGVWAWATMALPAGPCQNWQCGLAPPPSPHQPPQPPTSNPPTAPSPLPQPFLFLPFWLQRVLCPDDPIIFTVNPWLPIPEEKACSCLKKTWPQEIGGCYLKIGATSLIYIDTKLDVVWITYQDQDE